MTAGAEQELPEAALGRIEEAKEPAPRSLADVVVEALAVLCLVLITVLLLANALGRYLFATPVLWAEETATSLVIWLTMFGMYITARRGELIRVRSFVAKFPHQTRQAIDVVTDLISVIALAYLTWFGVSYLETFGGDRMVFLATSKGAFTAAIPIGAGALAVVTVLDLLHRFTKRSP